MSTKDNLIAARKLISDPIHWCKGTGARNADGSAVSPVDSKAVQWCAIGAVDKTAVTNEEFEAAQLALGEALKELSPHSPGLYVGTYNDGMQHANVLALYDKAIELAPDDD